MSIGKLAVVVGVFVLAFGGVSAALAHQDEDASDASPLQLAGDIRKNEVDADVALAVEDEGDGDDTGGDDGTDGGNNTGDGDRSRGNDGTDGGNNTGDGDRTRGNDLTSGGNITGDGDGTVGNDGTGAGDNTVVAVAAADDTDGGGDTDTGAGDTGGGAVDDTGGDTGDGDD